MARRRYELVCTAFDRKQRVIATATNDYKRSHPLYKHFAVLAGESPDKHYRHAEFNACLESKGRDIHSVLVQRFDVEGNPALAKPCKTCQLVLKSFGVRLVRYTTKHGTESYSN